MIDISLDVIGLNSMGYYSDVHACIDKKDLYKVLPLNFCRSCEIQECEDNLIYFKNIGIKLYADDEWDNFRHTLETLDIYHWITVGEDGTVEESYSDDTIIDWQVCVDTPEIKQDYTSPQNILYNSLINYISIVLPSELKLEHNKWYTSIKDDLYNYYIYLFPTEDKVILKAHLMDDVHSKTTSTLLKLFRKSFKLKKDSNCEEYYDLYVVIGMK